MTFLKGRHFFSCSTTAHSKRSVFYCRATRRSSDFISSNSASAEVVTARVAPRSRPENKANITLYLNDRSTVKCCVSWSGGKNGTRVDAGSRQNSEKFVLARNHRIRSFLRGLIRWCLRFYSRFEFDIFLTERITAILYMLQSTCC